MSYFYGPVPSRRLGFSLGVDLFSRKVCSFECVYCQAGATAKKSMRRFSAIDLNRFDKELAAILKQNPKIDYITFSGRGEPTLYKNLDKIILRVRQRTKGRYPIGVITNSSLLYRKDVRRQLQTADLVIPSLDAATPETFRKINRPCKPVTFKKIITGLVKLREEFNGKIWLEIMLVKGINDSLAQARKFKALVERIAPDKVQLNLPVRPSFTRVSLPAPARISAIKKIIGPPVEVVVSFRKKGRRRFNGEASKEIINYLRRRPAYAEDLVNSLAMNSARINKCLQGLKRKKKIKEYVFRKRKYFTIND